MPLQLHLWLSFFRITQAVEDIIVLGFCRTKPMQLDVHFQPGRSSFTYRLFFELTTRACLEKNNVIDLLCVLLFPHSIQNTITSIVQTTLCCQSKTILKQVEEKRRGGGYETRNSRSIKVFCDSLLFSTLRNYESSFTKTKKQKKKYHSKTERKKKRVSSVKLLCVTAFARSIRRHAYGDTDR